MKKCRREHGLKLSFKPVLCAALLLFFFPASAAAGNGLKLQELIDEALKKSPELLASEAGVAASRYRIPQAKSLPDPMVMFGYQNMGWSRITYGEMEDSQFMFSASQMFPFPGKRGLKGEMAERESESLAARYGGLRLSTIQRIKELFYDLFYTYKSLDLIKDRAALFSRFEDAASARYSAGRGMLQEVVMAQTEKYMLLEKEEMLRQKIQSTEAMLNSTIGREISSPLGVPEEPLPTSFDVPLDNIIMLAYAESPSVASKGKMLAAAEARVRMAEKEYYPDFTLTGSVMKRGKEFEDMWSLSVGLNIPLYYRNRQRQAVFEAKAMKAEAQNDIDAAKVMVGSAIRDNYAMARAAENLMDIYKNGLIPKTTQDFELAINGYISGQTEALTVITRLKSLIDFEQLYWQQFAEREKALARLASAAGYRDPLELANAAGVRRE